MLTVRMDRLAPGRAARALDLGCGRGRHVHALYTEGLDVVGLDLAFDDVGAARDGLGGFADREPAGAWAGWTVGDALALPFQDGAFDVVVCSEVLEHIPDYRAAIREIARVSAPGARLAITVPRAFPEWLCWRLTDNYPHTPGGHIRIFDERELRADAEQEGFLYRSKSFAHGLHSPYWWLQCADWGNKDESKLVAAYRRFLEWDILERPALTRTLARLADPLMGKSVALYFTRARPA
ncbi:MAG: class I SAM-dependent methyltransferase [Pseudomonadota bacterium]